MKTDNSQPMLGGGPERLARWAWILAAGFVLVLLLALREGLVRDERDDSAVSANPTGRDARRAFTTTERKPLPQGVSNLKPATTAEEIVAGKGVQFGKNRRKPVHAIAKHF